MNSNTNQNWTEEYLEFPRSCQSLDWLEDLNQVTNFDDRNKGHNKHFQVLVTTKPVPVLPKPDLDVNSNETLRFGCTDVRERMKEEMGEKIKLRKIGLRFGSSSKPDQDLPQVARGRGRGYRLMKNQAMREVGGGIPQMVSASMGTAHRLYKEERSCGDVAGSAGSTGLSSADGQDGGWNPLLDEENGQYKAACQHKAGEQNYKSSNTLNTRQL